MASVQHKFITSRKESTPEAIHWGCAPFLGRILFVAQQGEYIISVEWIQDLDLGQIIEKIRKKWKKDTVRSSDRFALELAAKLLSGLNNAQMPELPLLLFGSSLQVKVWELLLEIPFGSACSYKSIADKLNRPNSSRAIAGAVGANPVAILVPCHRVVNSFGKHVGYAWGLKHKIALASLEQEGLKKQIPSEG